MTCDSSDDGILVESEGFTYARNVGFLPKGKLLAEMEQTPVIEWHPREEMTQDLDPAESFSLSESTL